MASRFEAIAIRLNASRALCEAGLDPEKACECGLETFFLMTCYAAKLQRTPLVGATRREF